MKKVGNKKKYFELNQAYEDLFFGDYLKLLGKTPTGKAPARKTPIKKEDASNLLETRRGKKHELYTGKKIFLDEIIHDEFYYSNHFYIKEKRFLYEDDDCIIFVGLSSVYNSLLIEFIFKMQFNFDLDDVNVNVNDDDVMGFFDVDTLFYHGRKKCTDQTKFLARFTNTYTQSNRLTVVVHHNHFKAPFKFKFSNSNYFEYRNVVKLLAKHIREEFLNKLEL